MELKTLLDYNTLLTSPRVIKDLTPSMRESFLQLNVDVHHNLIAFFPNARILEVGPLLWSAMIKLRQI